MSHQRFISAIFFASTMFLGFAHAQQNFDKVEIKTEKLSLTTYVLFGAGGNIDVSISEDALFIIDDQYAPLGPKILAALRQLTDQPVKFVLNTHWHGDHSERRQEARRDQSGETIGRIR